MQPLLMWRGRCVFASSVVSESSCRFISLCWQTSICWCLPAAAPSDWTWVCLCAIVVGALRSVSSRARVVSVPKLARDSMAEFPFWGWVVGGATLLWKEGALRCHAQAVAYPILHQRRPPPTWVAWLWASSGAPCVDTDECTMLRGALAAPAAHLGHWVSVRVVAQRAGVIAKGDRPYV